MEKNVDGIRLLKPKGQYQPTALMAPPPTALVTPPPTALVTMSPPTALVTPPPTALVTRRKEVAYCLAS